MPDIIPIIEAIVAAMIAGKRPLMTPASKKEIALLVFAALSAGVGIFFLALALYQYLASQFIPPVAALVAAAAVFIIALLSLLLKKAISGEKTIPTKTVQEEFNETIHGLITSLRNELEDPIRENPKTSMAIAALTGMLAARRI